jgi:hypothetical protein
MSQKTPPTELAMRETLASLGLWWEEQVRVEGHAIDFVVEGETGLLLIDTNGDRWHRWGKIKACDLIKLNRVHSAGHCALGVWWSRQQRSPDLVRRGVLLAYLTGRLPWWDWAVPVSDLLPEARANVEARLVCDSDWSGLLRRAGSG